MEHDLHKIVMEMNQKIDALCKHMGCEPVSKDKFMDMSEDEKDEYQKKSMEKEE